MFDTVNTFMDINELESFKLSDAVKFNKTLNPRLWGRDEHLLPEVREKLMAIADDFRESLGVDGLNVKDITVSGSNAAYTYTPHSDVDLHLVVEFPQGQDSEIYRELFDAKKYQYNDQHNYKIGGYDVELYVQDADKTHHSQGIYSVLNNDWVSVPRRRQPDIDDISVQSKFEDIGHRIEQAISSGDPEQMAAISAKVKNMRQSGLDTTGEFGAENLAFKALRTQGLLDQLRTARNAVKDQALSIAEQERVAVEKNRTKNQGKFGGMWYPGFGYYTSTKAEDPESFDDGVEAVAEQKDIKQVLKPFVDSCVKYLGIEQAPKIVLKRDPEWTRRNGTFGRYDTDTRSVTLAVSGRHVLDILRTLAHELTHARQDEQAGMPVDAGETGSPYEDEANAMAGRIMRHWVDQYPEFFKDIPLDEDAAMDMANGQAARPGTPLNYPEGTVDVDVSDVYDWYKIGQRITNLPASKPKDFGQGPPHTILNFASEKEEEKYLQQLKALGLSVSDVPAGPNDPDAPTEVDEASLATMRDYFAGDEKARDPYEITKQRVHFSRDPGSNAAMQKRFKSPAEYEAWLKTKNALQVKLKESLDQPYKILRWEKGDYGDVDAIARLDDGTFLSIMFNKGFKQETKEEAWSVEFFRNNSQEKTGEGDQQRVFATVLSAIQTFISDRVPGAKGRYKPNKIYFSASKEVKPDEDQRKAMTRARLYDSLVQRYARALGFRAFRADTGKQVMYELSRIKQPVTEDSKTTEHYNGIEISMEKEDDEITVTAMMPGGRELGHVLFVIDGEYLAPQDLEVDERYQGQGIAATMYDYVKSKGYKIRRSGQQTDAGAGFWDKHKPGKNVWEQGVTEGKDFDRCYVQACKVYDRAEDKKLNPVLLQVAGYKGDGSNADKKWLALPQRVWQHYVVVVNDTVYDPTAKQFGNDKPTKYSVEKLQQDWDQQYQIRPKQDVDEAHGNSKIYDKCWDRYKKVPGKKRGEKGSCVEESSGYIPRNNKEAQDPRYSMAITQDIKPGEVQRQARKMGWTTDAAGRPPLLTSNAKNLRESQDSHMKIAHILKEATLGGFPVKVLNIQDQGVNEFALPGGDDREPDEEHILRQLAAQWWNGTEQQMARAQKTLAAMGWEIGQDESGDDDAGVFVIRVGDENGDSYIAFNHSELALDEARNNYHANRTGFRSGTRDTEGQDTQASQQVWGLKINGKVWNKQGKDVTFTSKQAAINTMNAILKNRPDLQGKIGLVTRGGVSEAIKLNAPQRTIPRDELQGYADRIKSGTKTKRDKFAPIIHGSNIRAITKDDENTEWDLDDLSRQITTRPKAILGTNAKMEKSKTEGEIIYDLTLPALSGIVVDEETGDFVEITTCPGAGACQLFCYARKGGYVMFPASSMSAAQALNFLVNDPEGYSARVNQEIKAVKARADKAGIQLVVRWHDAGDFFSKEYLDLAYDVAKSNPDVQFYAYTKMGDVATGSAPANFTMNFSSGSKRGEEKKVEFYKQQNPGATVKQGVTVPKNMFFDLIARNGNSLIKDAKGRTQFASPEALGTFKQRIAQQYKVAPDSIITYDQMLATPVGTAPKWNVIVQPGAGDRAANRKDVIDSYLMFH